MNDLISREAVISIATSSCLDLDSYDDTDEFCNEVKELPSAFDGMTNGEVMQAVYTDSEIEINETQNTVTVYLGADGDYCEDEVRFDLDWWNATYKAEREEIC